MTPSPDVELLIVDDQELVRLGMAMVLDSAPGIRVVGEAADGAAAVRKVRELRPHVVLMDVRMPGVDGLAATRTITASFPEVRVIVLTTFDLDEYAFGGLNSGASGFLLKDVPSDELVSAVRTVGAGDAIISPRVTRRMIELICGRLPSGPGAAADDGLTEREREVLVAIGAGLSNPDTTTGEKVFTALLLLWFLLLSLALTLALLWSLSGGLALMQGLVEPAQTHQMRTSEPSAPSANP